MSSKAWNESIVLNHEVVKVGQAKTIGAVCDKAILRCIGDGGDEQFFHVQVPGDICALKMQQKY